MVPVESKKFFLQPKYQHSQSEFGPHSGNPRMCDGYIEFAYTNFKIFDRP